MNSRRDYRNNKISLFDDIEEGGIRASSSYSHEIDEHDNERAMEGLQDRVILLKRVSYILSAKLWYNFMLLLTVSKVDGIKKMTEEFPDYVCSKQLSGDINEEVETHNRMLDRMGNDMDSSRGILSGTMDKFKMVFETKSSRRMFTLVASFLVIFLIVYYLTR
ncbi:hypothetical protein Pint_01764 [Pistacia integerrima]|uniref:Uncharacterized protein n=1 Tax=Pistacia integerrima TaxID=434235 RepID=A0ACC0ZNE3_9ROSI|nr:hypothetical protein Pint_01764 [Pistacia integerrima]